MIRETLDVEKLDKLRQAKGWSRNELAKRVGITCAGLINLMSEQGNPRLSTLVELAYVLEVRVSDLLKEAAPEEAQQAAS
jgi:transcriptional regulator with XRE-family HTH domain